MKRIVKYQKLTDIELKHKSDVSPYWDYHMNKNDGEEDPLANPDVLAEQIMEPSDQEIALKQILEDGFIRSKLNNREKAVFTKIFEKKKTHKQVANELGISHQRVSQIWKKVLVKFRKELLQND